MARTKTSNQVCPSNTEWRGGRVVAKDLTTYVVLDYCQYHGPGYRKRTRLAHSDKLQWIPRPLCNSRTCAQCVDGRRIKTLQQGKQSTQRSTQPPKQASNQAPNQAPNQATKHPTKLPMLLNSFLHHSLALGGGSADV